MGFFFSVLKTEKTVTDIIKIHTDNQQDSARIFFSCLFNLKKMYREKDYVFCFKILHR